jgi:hypothetical protein
MRNRILSVGLAVLSLSCVAVSCGKKETLPAHEKRFARVYAELALLRGRLPLADPAYADSVKNLLQKRGYTTDDFRKSLAYFNASPERWAVFYREVKSLLPPNKSSGAVPR